MIQHKAEPFRQLDGKPLFDEPWQAEILAMADNLIAAGTISPSNWSSTLGAELANAKSAGKDDDMNTYYEAALKALEQILMINGNLDTIEINKRQKEWEAAYLATPHGHPVELKKHSPAALRSDVVSELSE